MLYDLILVCLYYCNTEKGWLLLSVMLPWIYLLFFTIFSHKFKKKKNLCTENIHYK